MSWARGMSQSGFMFISMKSIPHTAGRPELALKTLFLDFDGVLHGMSQTSARPFERIYLLEPLVDVAPFAIVVSSSWRFHFELSEIRQRLGRLNPLVVGTTGEAIVGRNARHREILSYVQHHQINDWRALDDAYLEFPDDAAGLVLCNPRTGVTEREVRILRDWLIN